MNDAPPVTLLNTFRVALLLKLVGIITALLSGYLLLRVWMIPRWWLSLLFTLGLLLWLGPWRGWNRQPVEADHRQLRAALLIATISPYLEVIQSANHNFLPMMDLPLFIERFSWTIQQINEIHAFGFLFVMVPVILSSWQYSFRGMWTTLLLAGLLYLLTPLFLPDDAFDWGLYAVRGFVLLGTTLIVAFTVATLATAQKREQQAVAAANKKLAAANQQLAQQTAVLEQLTISRERNRLARELHDTLAHSLSATAVQLQAIGTLIPIDPAAATTELRQAQQQIRHGLHESRRAIAALRASPLEQWGLAAAVRRRAERIADRNELKLTCQIEEPLPLLPPLTEQTIYRAADECLLNVEKHAAATAVTLRLEYEGRSVEDWQWVRLLVSDDGVGFEPEAGVADGRYGLLGLAERAALVNGQLEIEAQPGGGTTVQLTIKDGAWLTDDD